MMGQNVSTAVMQRRTEAHDSLDDFPTPPWATRALCEFLRGEGEALGLQVVREPAANRGYMVRPLAEYFAPVEASDVHDYGMGWPVEDYLFPGNSERKVGWTITNPPFRLAEEFIEKARRTSLQGCAVIVRSAFLEGVGRHGRIFATWPPTFVLQFAERVVMHRGRVSADGSTATAYCWLVWRFYAPRGPTQLRWIAPCRARLERPGDYDLWPRPGDVA
jgi:hypothetical protein